MVLTLERRGFIQRVPGQARSIGLIVPPESLPRLEPAQRNVAAPAPSTKTKTPTGTLFQFKIQLLYLEPAIWRRIQVSDCTLDQFHSHIQTAMGWTNSHLHRFTIGEQLYGDPALLEDMDHLDSTKNED